MEKEDTVELGSNNGPSHAVTKQKDTGAFQSMKIEEEDSRLNFAGDKWLRHSFEMKEEREEKIQLKQENKENNDDDLSMVSDTWTRQSFEMEEEEGKIRPRVPIVIRIRRTEKNCTKQGNNSKENLNNQNFDAQPAVSNSTVLPIMDESKGIKQRKVANKKIKTGKLAKIINNSVLEHATVSETAENNKCVFQCAQCPCEYSSWSSLKRHVRVVHQEHISITNFNHFLIKATVHVCKICSKMVLCDSIFLTTHIQVHRMNINEYRRVYKAAKITTNPVLEQATLSETADCSKCVFQCYKCPCQYNSWSAFKKHMKVVHHEHISASSFQQFLIKATVHICKVCSKKILCDSDFLRFHIPGHNLTVSQYRKLYNCDFDWKKHNQEILKNAKCSPNYIGNLCKFRCLQCKRSFQSISALCTHASITRSKNTKCVKKIQLKHLHKYLKNVVTHKCKICNELVLCDKEFIKKHALYFHGLKSAKEYADKTGCSLEIPMAEKATMNGKKVDNSIGNFCRYTCHKCEHTSECWYLMQKHLKSTDHWSSSGKKWPQYISKTIVHECLICKKLLLNERTFMEEHLRNNHHLTLLKYTKKYNITYICKKPTKQ